jgi:MFS family permease
VPTVLKGRVAAADELPDATKVPVWSLLLLGGAALAVSVAQLPRRQWATIGLLVLGAVLMGTFVVVDRRLDAAVLPPSVFGRGPLKWIYLQMAVQMAAVLVDTYVPLFTQRLGHLTPVAAGFVGATLALGWTISEIGSASLRDRRLIARLVACAPLLMASGLLITATTQLQSATTGVVALWTAGLLVAGVGIGVAWPHLSMWAMDCVDDPAESGAAAAAINTVQLISAAFGAGLAGVVVNSSTGGDLSAARWLYATFTLLAALGIVASLNGFRLVPRHAQSGSSSD